jgi:hypothetical protein
LPLFLTGNECVGGEREPDISFEMVVVIFATDIATIFMDFFNDQPDIDQARKGYFFTHL